MPDDQTVESDPKPAERIGRYAFAPLTVIIGTVAAHDVLYHGAFRTASDPLWLFDLFDMGLATVLTAIELFRPQAAKMLQTRVSPEETAPADESVAPHRGYQLVNEMLAGRVEEHERELAASQAALMRENEERTHAEEKLLRMSTLDHLTGLFKRSAFLSRLENERARCSGQLAVFFIDLDHFKLINDGLGDAIADRVLIAVGDRLAHLAPSRALVGRVGGDEFVLACEVEDMSAAMSIGDHILSVIGRPIAVETQRIHTSASLGLRISGTRNDRAATMLRDAHTAMHRAKHSGRARLVCFDEAMRDEVQSQYALTSDLHEAVLNRQIFVEYQPIQDIRSGRIVAYEALARWEHPDRGRVEPGVFIPAAEDTGLVAAIGERVLRDACEQIVLHKITSATPIGINLSVRQIAQPDLCEIISRIINHYGIDPMTFVFEVTESTIVESLNMARGVLLRLKELGLRLAIDDFGTGYSSLSYLRSLPFDVLKIDRAFVRHIDTEEHSRDIVRMIVTLAESLDMSVVAEGIETPEQLETLRILGCSRGQGYLFSRPLAADAAFAKLAEQNVMLEA